MTFRTPRRRGIALFELLIGIILLTAFAVVATRLLYSSVKLSDRAGIAHSQLMAMESAIRMLRNDVWGSSTIQLTDENLITLSYSDAPSIAWTVGENGELTRTVKSQPPQHWPWKPHGPRIAFATAGPTLVARIQTVDQAADSELRFASQMQLAERLGK